MIDLDLDQVRAEAARGVSRPADGVPPVPADEASFEVSALEFVRGAAEPPTEVDLDDVEHCVGKVIVALRRNGDRLTGAVLRVRYHVGTGRVLSIVLHRADDAAAQREVYRRAEGALSATG